MPFSPGTKGEGVLNRARDGHGAMEAIQIEPARWSHGRLGISVRSVVSTVASASQPPCLRSVAMWGRAEPLMRRARSYELRDHPGGTGPWSHGRLGIPGQAVGVTVASVSLPLALRSVAILAQGRTLSHCVAPALIQPHVSSPPPLLVDSAWHSVVATRETGGGGALLALSRITGASCAPIWGFCREFRLASGSPPVPACFCWGRVGEPPPTAFRGCERPRRFAARLRSRAFPMKQAGSGRRNNAREPGSNLCTLLTVGSIGHESLPSPS